MPRTTELRDLWCVNVVHTSQRVTLDHRMPLKSVMEGKGNFDSVVAGRLSIYHSQKRIEFFLAEQLYL